IGIYAEFCFPGTVIPGSAGGVLFLLSIAAFVEMGVRPAAALMVVAGFILITLDAWSHARWVLASAGAVLIMTGFARLHPGMRPLLSASIGAPLAIITTLLLSIAVQASENKKQKGGVVFWHSDDIFSSVGSTPKTKAFTVEGSDSRRVN